MHSNLSIVVVNFNPTVTAVFTETSGLNMSGGGNKITSIYPRRYSPSCRGLNPVKKKLRTTFRVTTDSTLVRSRFEATDLAPKIRRRRIPTDPALVQIAQRALNNETVVRTQPARGAIPRNALGSHYV